MNTQTVILIIVLMAFSAIATSALHDPVSVLYFKLSEPYFRSPIEPKNNQLRVRGDSYGSGEFGAKRSGGRSHEGIDILAPIGTKVYAAKSGLAFYGNVPTGYGQYIMIYHPDRSQTVYAHLLKSAVPYPKKVRRGELIGFSGNTGNAKNDMIKPHLHFEIRKNGSTIDPRKVMR